MFNKGICSTALTCETADRLFTNINAHNAPDQSFSATLRALLRKRLPQDETVWLTCKELHVSVHDIESSTVLNCMNLFTQDIVRYPVASEHNILIIHTTQRDAGEKMLEMIRTNAGMGKRYMSNYSIREDLRVFYARKLNALFYTDDTKRNTVIFTDRLELKHFHALQMMIPKYLPVLFEDNPLTLSEIELLKSTGNTSAVEYELLIEEFSKDLDIRSEIIRTKLTGFETAFERIRITEIKNELAVYRRDYDNYLSDLRNLEQSIQNCLYTLAGLECDVIKRSEDSELMEYFICSKNLTLIKAVDTTVEFVVHGYADVYDPDAFEKYAANHDGYMYYHLNPCITKHQMEKLYRSVFEERRYKLRICAAYTADMRTGLKAVKGYYFPSESKTYLPNPHIQHFGCIGSYAMRFQEYMSKRDYVGAIDQAVVSARNLNFYDSSVMSMFSESLSNTAIKCIEKQDGTLITPQEAITELEGDTVCQDQ